MPDHIFGDVDRHMATPIMHPDSMPDHLREDGAGATPGADDLFFAAHVELLNFLEKFGVNERTLLE